MDINRRQFLYTAAAGTAAAPAALARQAWAVATPAGMPDLPRVKIGRVYAGTSGGAWPGPKFDAAAEIARYETLLAGMQDRLGPVELVGGEQVASAQEAEAVARRLGDVDALLVFDLNFDDGSRVAPLVAAGKPTALFVYPFTGHQWMYYSQWVNAGKKLLLVPTSDYEEIARAIRLVSVPARMSRSRILAVGRPHGTPAACTADLVEERLGPRLVVVSNDEVMKAFQAADPQAAEAEAEQYWLGPARRIVEPSRADVVAAARLFLAMRSLMAEHGAQAITSSHCMGAPAKGCLAFSKINDLGYVGACEGDMDSTLTMLLFAYAFGVPGFISDPLFDLAKSALLHAHCTCATMLDGAAGTRAPFVIRSQCDSEQGVSLEVEMRVGQAVTCAKLANCEALLVSPGTIAEIPDYYDRGCRTQIATRVPDPRAMLARWGGGVLGDDMMTLLHRVVFYGDHRPGARDLAGLLGLDLIEEG